MTRVLLVALVAVMAFAGWQTYQLGKAREDSAQDFIETMERINADDLDPDDRAAVLERLRSLSE